MEAKVNIKINQQPNDGDTINAKYVVNGATLPYTSGEEEISKTFVEGITKTQRHIGATNINGTYNGYLGDFDGRVNVVLEIASVFIVGGLFSTYTVGGTTYNANNLIILQSDGQPFASLHNDIGVSGEVNDIDFNIDDSTFHIVGDFADSTGLQPGTLSPTSAKAPCYMVIRRSDFAYSEDFLANYVPLSFGTGYFNCVKLWNGRVFLGGTFENFEGQHNYVMMLTEVLTINQTFSNNIDVNSSVTTIEAEDTNTAIWIGGDFNIINGVGRTRLAKVSISANLDTSFAANLNEIPYKIRTRNNNLYIGGEFTAVNGNTMNNFARVDKNTGVLDQSYTLDPHGVVYDFNFLNSTGDQVLQPNLAVVGSLNSNGNGRLYLNTMLISNIFFDDTIRSVAQSEDNERILLGGDFLNWNSAGVSGNEYVTIGNDIEETRDNLLNNLNTHNVFDPNTYENISVGTDEIDVIYTFYNPNDLVEIVDVEDTNTSGIIRVDLSVSNESQDVLDFARPLLTRSDYYIKSSTGNQYNWNNVDFEVYEYEGNVQQYVDIDIPTQAINKPRLTSAQNNQYLNIARLVEAKKRNILTYYQADGGSLLMTGKQARFAFTRVVNKLGNIQSDSRIDLGIILDGYRKSRRELNEFPTILTNGRKREAVDEYRVPFLLKDVDTVEVVYGNNFEVYLIDPELFNPMDSNAIISYFRVLKSEYDTNNVTVRFLKSGNLVDDFKVDFVDSCSEVNDVNFVNSWGVIETIQFFGRSKLSLKLDDENYDRNIRDINSNYEVHDHTNVSLYKDGKETISINTGKIRPYMNEALEDLSMSKEIWVLDRDKYSMFGNYGDDIMPVRLDRTNFNRKYIVTDRTIDYTFDFEIDNNLNKNIN